MNNKIEQAVTDEPRGTAAGGHAEIINVPGCPPMVRAVDYNAPRAQLAEPIDMVLHCPACGMQHIDAVEELPMPMPGSSFEGSAGWANPPHRSHLCHGCGHIWRPADVPTNGVEAVKTCGKADSKLAAPTDTLRAQLAEAQRELIDKEAERAAMELERNNAQRQHTMQCAINKTDSQRILELTTQLAEAQRDAEVSKQINRACMELPDDFRIAIELERDSGCVYLLQEDEDIGFYDSCDGIARSISAAIDAAKGESNA